MALSVVRGLILKETKVGEADKILTLLIKGIGKMSVSARGARKTQGMLSSGTSVFTYADFTLKSGSKYYYLVQADIIESFYTLTKELDNLAYASYMLELADKTTMEEVPADNTLRLTINLLKKIADKKLNPKLAASIYELKLLQYSGFMPYLHCCVRCGKRHDNIIGMQGVLCTDCAGGEYNTLTVNETTIYTMKYILANEPPLLLSFSIDEKTLLSVAKISSKMIDAHFALNLNSKKFLNSLNLY